jgi:3-methyladenine DNA glycosylase Tag
MAKAVFSSGFSWTVIEKKWPGFEVAFDRFDPKKVAVYGDEKIDALLKDTRIVRNGAKIMATIENARFVVATAKAHGSFAKFLANWPATDQVGTDGSPEETRLAHGRGDSGSTSCALRDGTRSFFPATW